MNIRCPLLLLPAALTIAALTACAASTPSPAPTMTAAESEDGHGEVAGADEVSEPPLGLLSIDADGAVGSLDLLTGDAVEIGAVGTPQALTSDGRYAFVTTADGLSIVDSGRWSWDHGDHFHYYLAPPSIVGVVPGAGPATVTSGTLSTAGSTGVFFGSGDAVLLDNSALADGEIEERFRIETGQDAGIIAPLGNGALVTIGDRLEYYDSVGATTGAATECVDASGAITTCVGLLVGCADGAVLATWERSAPAFQPIPYPDGAYADRAAAFDGRKNRPTVAALAGADGFWLLDSRALAWQFVATEVPLARVVAVDDADGHVVALDTAGRVRIYTADSGDEVGATEPLLAEVGDTVSLTVDAQRAYLNDPASGTVLEIDYADGGRVARTLQTPTAPLFVTEVGR